MSLRFVRNDTVKLPLQHPYDGPFKVLNRTAKHFTLDIAGKKKVISLDRLKPAYLDNSLPSTNDATDDTTPTETSTQPTNPTTQMKQPTSTTPPPATPSSNHNPPRTTRSGRCVHWPCKLAEYRSFS